MYPNPLSIAIFCLNFEFDHVFFVFRYKISKVFNWFEWLKMKRFEYIRKTQNFNLNFIHIWNGMVSVLCLALLVSLSLVFFGFNFLFTWKNNTNHIDQLIAKTISHSLPFTSISTLKIHIQRKLNMTNIFAIFCSCISMIFKMIQVLFYQFY